MIFHQYSIIYDTWFWCEKERESEISEIPSIWTFWEIRDFFVFLNNDNGEMYIDKIW